MSIRPADLSPDPIMTNFAVQAGVGGPFIADEIAPVVPVDQAYKYPVYPRAELKAPPETRVGIGGKPNKYRFLAPVWTEAQSTRHALDDEMPLEVQMAPGNSFLQRQGSRAAMLTHSLKMGVETRIKAALDAATYTAGALVKYDAGTGTPDAEPDFDIAKAAIELRGGIATHVIIPAKVARVMKKMKSIRDLRKETNSELLVNGDLPPVLWNLKVIIPGALTDTAESGLAATIGYLWDTETIYVLMVDPSVSANQEAFTALIQARYSAWGSPFQAYSWPNPHQSQRTVWSSVDLHQNEHVLADGAIYRITDTLT